METIEKTHLQTIIHQYEEQIGGKWKPDERFYNKVRINRKRMGMLVRREKLLFGYEIKNLSEFFGVPFETLL